MENFFKRLNEPENKNKKILFLGAAGVFAGFFLAFVLVSITAKKEQAKHTFLKSSISMITPMIPQSGDKTFPATLRPTEKQST